MKGFIFDIKRFAVHDGPGIRSTLFLKGCPMRCFWCHNPEGLEKAPRLWYFANKCMACGLCIESCPTKALSRTAGENYSISIDHELCTSCGICTEQCPTTALEFDGREADHTELIPLMLKDKTFFAESGGGITLSGGDPIFQADFAALILEGCQKEGVHTAMESALYCSRSTLEKIIPHTDLFISDLKILDENAHKEYTAVSNERILENLRFLALSGKDLLVRTPLIPGYSATDQNLKGIASFLEELGELRGRPVQAELLNYNSLAPNKYHIRKEENHRLESMKQIPLEQIRSWEDMFRDKGIDVISEHY